MCDPSSSHRESIVTPSASLGLALFCKQKKDAPQCSGSAAAQSRLCVLAEAFEGEVGLAILHIDFLEAALFEELSAQWWLLLNEPTRKISSKRKAVQLGPCQTSPKSERVYAMVAMLVLMMLPWAVGVTVSEGAPRATTQ